MDSKKIKKVNLKWKKKIGYWLFIEQFVDNFLALLWVIFFRFVLYREDWNSHRIKFLVGKVRSIHP